MFGFGKKSVSPPSESPKMITTYITIYKEDDLFVRAEKIAQKLNYYYRNSDVISIYKILKAYDNLDKNLPVETGNTGFYKEEKSKKKKSYESPSDKENKS